MGSPTKVYMTRVRLKTRKQGRKRKNKLARCGTTPTKATFFGDMLQTSQDNTSAKL